MGDVLNGYWVIVPGEVLSACTTGRQCSADQCCQLQEPCFCGCFSHRGGRAAWTFGLMLPRQSFVGGGEEISPPLAVVQSETDNLRLVIQAVSPL